MSLFNKFFFLFKRLIFLSLPNAKHKCSSLAYSAWNIEQWEPAMLETAMRIAQKWKGGFG